MEFPLNTNSAQAPDNDFILLNNQTASGTANTDEFKNGLLPESFVPSFPTRHANAQQSSLVNREIIGRESEVWNPYSPLPPLSTCSSALTTEEPSWDVVFPYSSTVLAPEDENYALDLQLLLMADLDTAYDVCNPYSDQLPLHIGDSNKQSNEMVGGVSENHFMVSTLITKWQEYYMEDLKRILKNRREPQENINSRFSELDHGKKKRKPNDGRKRCCCKKSECIQRYCECFYSGVFCDDACGCKGCNNTIEQGTLVLEKRAKMVRKNSLAFAPKIVPLHRWDSELPRIQLFDQNKRHKRGCSCTKSKCLKNYCECYQANVKCSVACRCKGCGNMDTQKHDVGPANFMIGTPMNNNVNTHRFHSNGGEMLPQAEASNNNIGRQAQMSFISSLVPLQRWVPRESTTFGNSIISYPTFGPRLPQSMNFYEASPNHNGTPVMLNDSRFPIETNSSDRKWIPPPRFPVLEAGSDMRPPLPPLIPVEY